MTMESSRSVISIVCPPNISVPVLFFLFFHRTLNGFCADLILNLADEFLQTLLSLVAQGTASHSHLFFFLFFGANHQITAQDTTPTSIKPTNSFLRMPLKSPDTPSTGASSATMAMAALVA